MLAAASAANLAEAAKAIAAAGGLAPMAIAGDLRTLEGCQQVFDQVNARFKRCDVLVNNAGATKGGKFSDQPDADWIDGFALKFFGAVRLTRLFWPLLKEAHGNIVNIIGGAARTRDPNFLLVARSTRAFANFSKGLAPMGNKDDININVIHPGSTQTDRVEMLFQQYAKAQDKTVEQVRDEAVSKSGIRRIAQPEDVAELALFLASAKARHIQGAAIGVDGKSPTSSRAGRPASR